MKLDPRQVLIEVRQILADPDHWTKGTIARTRKGVDVDPYSPEASCWCLMGAGCLAVQALDPDNSDQRYQRANVILRDAFGFAECFQVVQFNDQSTHSQIIDTLNRAIDTLNRP